MVALIKPRRLRAGDKVAVISPSWGGPGAVPHRYAAGKRQIEQLLGLEVVEMPHALAPAEYVAQHPEARAADLMTQGDLITVREGAGRDEARALLRDRKIERVIVVDEDYRATGLITMKDIEKAQAHPNAAKDEQGRLLVGAASTVGDAGYERAMALADAGWRRSDPWLTSFVDADTTSPGRMLGLAPGRSAACVRDWLAEQSPAFRDAIEVVVIDTSAPYASGIRAALPDAKIAVDKWHLVALANTVVTEVRQRVTRERYGRRGTTAEKVWVNRHLLLTGYEHLSAKQRARLKATFAGEDPTNEIGAAWGVKERLRLLLAESEEHRIRHRLYEFYRDAARADMPETTRLATTIETWWPAIHVALTMDVTNARTEGFNRIIKNTKRVACGFRNLDNYQRRILSTIALTRARRDAA